LGQTKAFCISTVDALYGGSPSKEKSGAATGAAKDGPSSKEHKKAGYSIEAMVTSVVYAAEQEPPQGRRMCSF
jgi:hypothetical protein